MPDLLFPSHVENSFETLKALFSFETKATLRHKKFEHKSTYYVISINRYENMVVVIISRSKPNAL